MLSRRTSLQPPGQASRRSYRGLDQGQACLLYTSHIEKLHNLEQLPSTGFTVSCFPVKIERASAGWTRAVAIIDA